MAPVREESVWGVRPNTDLVCHDIPGLGWEYYSGDNEPELMDV